MKVALFAIGLFLAGALGAHVCGCSPKQMEPAVIEKRAQAALDLEQYGRALAACRLTGKDAGSVDVYEACAKTADVKYGVKP